MPLHMTKKEEISEQDIITCLNIDYGIKVKKLTHLPVGADMNAFVYKASEGDEHYFVKLKRYQGYENRAAI